MCVYVVGSSESCTVSLRGFLKVHFPCDIKSLKSSQCHLFELWMLGKHFPEKSIIEKTKQKKIKSSASLLLLDPPLEKKKKEGRKQTQRFCLENAALAEAVRRSRMHLPWYFIYELIYEFWTAFNDPPLSLWVWALGSIKAAQCVKLGALEVSGKPPQHNLWSH